MRDVEASTATTGTPARGMTISMLAERTGVAPETIRFYERVGVLPRPVRVRAADTAAGGRSHAGYRQYGTADVERLAFVRRVRDLGFSLDNVRDLLSMAGDPGHSCADVDSLARAHLAHVDAKLAQLTALRTELERVIGDCRGGLPVAECRILRALTDDSDDREMGEDVE